jgi:hypothetical protein
MATFAMMKETADRRAPAGEGIVVRPMGAKFGHTVECRYCHEKGHQISTWNHSTRVKLLTCPKLVAKEQRAQQRQARWSQQREQAARRQSQRSLGAWMPSANALKGSGVAQDGWTGVGRAGCPGAARHLFAAACSESENMLQKQLAKTVITNRFSALEGKKVKRAPSRPSRVAPEVRKPQPAIGAWAPRVAVAQVSGGDEALLKRKCANQKKKSVSFAGDHEDLMKPPCSIVYCDSANWADAEEEDLDDFFAQPLAVVSN